MPPERNAGDPDATGNPRSAIEVAVYPSRVGRAGDGRPCSPARAYRLPDDPDRAAAAERTAGSRRTVSAAVSPPAPAALPPAPALPAAPRPAPAAGGAATWARGAPPATSEPARPKHLAPARWYRRVALGVLRLVRTALPPASGPAGRRRRGGPPGRAWR